MSADPSLKIASMVLPTKGYRVLLPNSAIEEVRTIKALKPRRDTSNKYLAGYTDVADQAIPVIAFEQLGTPDMADTGGKPVIVILKPYNDKRIALLASNTPNFVLASTQTIQQNYSPQREHPYASVYALMHQREILVPDLKKLSQL